MNNNLDFEFQFENYHFPKLGFIKIPTPEIPGEDKIRLDLPPGCNTNDYLLSLTKESFETKIKQGKILEKDKKKYWERLEHEYNEISKLRFTDYILLVYEVIRFCKKEGILNGFGRGSAASSCLLYVLDCTGVDPIEHDLLFERFISSARTEIKEMDGEVYIASGSLPDVDIDSQRSQKYKINEFIQKKFPGKTAAICNISTFQSKTLIKEVLKSFEEYKEEQTKLVANLIEVEFGKVEKISHAAEENEKFAEWAKEHSETIEICENLANLAKNKSVHASGIIICNEKIEDVLPLELDSNKDIVCGYSMDDAQMFGIKLDNLGLKSLDAIKQCLDLIGKKLLDIDVNDSSIYEFLNKSDNYYGVFQAEEGLGKKTLQDIEPQNIEDVTASIALGRPGSARFIGDYIKNKNSGEDINLDPRIKEIYKATNYVIIYQEQIMKLCQIMANFTPLETNNVRKGIAKKVKEKLLEYKEKFIKQSIENGFNEEFVRKTWGQFEDAGDYSFNKSHAAAYSFLTSACCFLKKNHPLEFYYSLLKNAQHEAKPLEEYQVIFFEMLREKLNIHPPHIIKSDFDFTIENKGIRIGLGNIKGISDKSREKLAKFKTQNLNKFQIFQASKECEVPISVLSSLILVGSMDDLLTESRTRTLVEAILWNLLKDKERQKCLELGDKYGFHLTNLVKALNKEIKDDKNKPFIKDSRMETIRKHFNPYYQQFKNNSKNEKFSQYWFENELLGFSFSTNLHEIYSPHYDNLLKIEEINDCSEGEYVNFVGEVSGEVKNFKSQKKGTPTLKLDIKDHTGVLCCLAFNSKGGDTIDEIEENNGRLPKEKDIVIGYGKKMSDAVFLSRLKIEDHSVVKKISELKDIKQTKDKEIV
jgi:DNA-directed DNA polymerase III PolC